MLTFKSKRHNFQRQRRPNTFCVNRNRNLCITTCVKAFKVSNEYKLFSHRKEETTALVTIFVKPLQFQTGPIVVYITYTYSSVCGVMVIVVGN